MLVCMLSSGPKSNVTDVSKIGVQLVTFDDSRLNMMMIITLCATSTLFFVLHATAAAGNLLR